MGMHARQTYYALASVPFWLEGVLAVIGICRWRPSGTARRRSVQSLNLTAEYAAAPGPQPGVSPPAGSVTDACAPAPHAPA